MKNYFYLIIIIFLISNNSIAQPGWTVYDNTNTILSTGVYTAIAIDLSGNIWSGNYSSGLYKFDGTTWTRFGISNSSILSESITDIVVDNSNKVWTGTNKGVSVYDGTTFMNYDTNNASFDGFSIYTLAKDNNGVIWLASKTGSFGYKGITTFDGSVWTNLTGYPTQISNAEFSDFAFAANNDAWLACNNGFAKYNGTAFTYYPPVTTLPGSQVTTVDANGIVWVGGFDALVKYDGNTWTKYDNVADLGLVSNTLYYDMLSDGNTLWIACSEGLVKFNKNTATVVENFNSLNSPLEDNCVTKITKDANGIIWLSTTIGVVKMDPAIVGVEENASPYMFSIYPNPVVDQLNIEFSDYNDVTLELLSSDGRLLQRMDLNSAKTRIDIDNFVAGIYFAKVMGTQGITVKKFIKR